MKSILHLYIRVSSTVQVEGTSLKTQKEIGIALAKKLGMGYEIHNEGGKSSSKDDLDNRPVMMNLLRLMDKGIVKHLYVWNTDRLSRNQITWYSIRQKMVKNEVVLYTPKGIHNQQDEMENMVLGILSEVSQYDNKIRAERSRLGKFEKVKLNYWRGGDCAYGYKLQNDGVGNKLDENKEESKWVKYIFSEYAKGTTLKEIRIVLEKHKVKTRRGNKQWSLGSLQLMLRNKLYIGVDIFYDKKSKLTITNQVPPIISNKLYEKVAERRGLLLLRKGQINRTKKFYLFRDFLFCGGCNSPMGGKIKPALNVNSYYCPITERKFNSTYQRDITCEMKKSLHIPSADSILWKTICEILSNSYSLKEQFKAKTIIGKKLNTEEIKSLINKNDLQIRKLTSEKNEIEKGLVKIETENLLLNYSSKNVYEKLKKELNDRYKKILIQIEDLNNTLADLGNKENWFNWIDGFGEVIRKNEKITDVQKKDFLSNILESIIVNYDDEKKLHRLKINFKLPVFIEEDTKRKSGINSALSNSKSSISLVKSNDQLISVGNYSTVTDFAKFLG